MVMRKNSACWRGYASELGRTRAGGHVSESGLWVCVALENDALLRAMVSWSIPHLRG